MRFWMISFFFESETAAMTAYVIYRGIKEGLLEETYKYRADRIREALYKKIDDRGIVKDASGLLLLQKREHQWNVRHT